MLTRDSAAGFVEKLSPTHYSHDPKNANSLINNLVLTMAEDFDHKLWFGTNSGLCRFDPVAKTFRSFSVKNGFPDDLIMGILSDEKGHVWVSHKKGLTRVNVRNYQTLDFNSHDGLQGNEFTQNAYFRNLKTGEMFFGGTNGIK